MYGSNCSLSSANISSEFRWLSFIFFSWVFNVELSSKSLAARIQLVKIYILIAFFLSATAFLNSLSNKSHLIRFYYKMKQLFGNSKYYLCKQQCLESWIKEQTSIVLFHWLSNARNNCIDLFYSHHDIWHCNSTLMFYSVLKLSTWSLVFFNIIRLKIFITVFNSSTDAIHIYCIQPLFLFLFSLDLS